MHNVKTKETAKLTVHNDETGESALVEVVYNFYSNPGSYDEPPFNDIELLEVKNAPEWATDSLIMSYIDMYEAELGLSDYDIDESLYEGYDGEWEE